MPTSEPMSSVLGKPQSRIDGPLKVSGRATYTSNYDLPGMLYAVPVGATSPKGRLLALKTDRAQSMTEQRLRLGATHSGKLLALQHDYANTTSLLDTFVENCGEATPYLYSTPNLGISSGVARRSTGAPTWMRGPGAVPGLFALESAMDEMAIKLGMDPVAFRHANEPAIDEGLGIPFSSRHLIECIDLGAEKFGWTRRTPRNPDR